MALYYPQGAIILRVTWEDFGSDSPVLKETTVMPVSCRNLRVERNDYSEADTFSARIDYKSFPFDPRCIRALGVTVCMEDRKEVFKKSNDLSLIVPSVENTIFQGFADEGSVEFDDDTRSVEIEGRDFTSLFIDTKRLNTSPIPLSKPIDEIIQSLILEQEATKDIKVVNRTGEPLPTLSKLAPDFNPVTSVKNQKRKETYWDIIQDILSRIGLLGFIEIDKFVIAKPQNIYEKKEIKQFLYGGNVKTLKYTRKLGRSKNYNVKINSINIAEKRVEEVKIPEDATDPEFISNFGGIRITIPQLDKDGKKIEPPKDAEFLTFPVKDVSNKEQLIKIGESVYEELSRQQIEGSLSTFEMEVPEEVDSGSKPVNFNQIRNGTAIKIYMSQDELNEISSTSKLAEKRNFLIRRGYPIKVATAFAESLNRINTAFYTKSVTFNLDQDNGFEMNINFINFIDLDSNLLGGN